ncbi:Uncharacterised protein [uncultured archaeon]|nr:Uncharacterised protein [uncultured archaeon]
MKRKYLAVEISIIDIILLILGSITNVAGYQTVQSSNQKTITEEINQKELLFQTIIDIANNKEIQRLLLVSTEIRKGEFFNQNIKFPEYTPCVLTKTKLNIAYYIGLVLSKIISTSKIQMILERFQLSQKGIQKEISTVIEKNATLTSELKQLSNLNCGCENTNTTYWIFPVLCTLLFPLVLSALIIFVVSGMQIGIPLQIMLAIGTILNCWWT